MTDNEVKWMIVGKLLRRNLMAGVKEATMYSYNGVVLPKLPVMEGYTYVLLYQWGASSWFCLVSTEPLTFDGVNCLTVNGATAHSMYANYAATWGDFSEIVRQKPVDFRYNTAIWSNHNIINTVDGSVYLAKSDPVPIYE